MTGAGGAIGGAVTEALGGAGVQLALLGRSRAKLADAAAASGGEALLYEVDVTDPGGCQGALDDLAASWGGLDIVVHCAAITEGNVALEALTTSQIDQVLTANIAGALHIARASVPLMKGRAGPSIVNVASVAAHQALPGRVLYGTSKAALVHLTMQLAVELGPLGIRVNSISPGQTPTYMAKAGDEPGAPAREKEHTQGEAAIERIPLRRRGTLQDYVGPVLFLCSDLACYVTGVDICVDGGAMVVW